MRFLTKSVNLYEWTVKYLEIYKKPFIKASTFERYETCLKHIPSQLKLKELTTEQLQKIINNMMSSGLSVSSIRQVKILLNQALKQAKKLGYKVGADFTNVDLPKNLPKKIRALAADEQLQLIKNAKISFYGDFFIALLVTGCRVGELIALEWSDIDFKGGFFEINKTDYKGHSQEPKTRDSVRRLPLNDEFREILIRKYNLGVSGRIFRNTLGRSIVYRTLLDSWHRVLDASGLPWLGLHVLRHTYATNALQAGVNVKVLSKLLGHGSVSITLDIYCDISDNDKEIASQTLSSFYDNLVSRKKKTALRTASFCSPL